jgi:hypothetical protein
MAEISNWNKQFACALILLQAVLWLANTLCFKKRDYVQ